MTYKNNIEISEKFLCKNLQYAFCGIWCHKFCKNAPISGRIRVFGLVSLVSSVISSFKIRLVSQKVFVFLNFMILDNPTKANPSYS